MTSLHRLAALVLATTALFMPSAAAADVGDDLSGDAVVGFRRFEQQVKSEIGGVRGERLVEENELSLGLSGGYRIWRWFSIGAFARWDVGSRSAGRFEGLDTEGRTIVVGEVGGAFHELWLGPLVSFRKDWFRASVGYGALGFRLDRARDDLAAGTDTSSALRTSPTVAWLVALDAIIPTGAFVEPMVRLEYRVRYYDRRAGTALDDELVHGTQNFTPMFGVSIAR